MSTPSDGGEAWTRFVLQGCAEKSSAIVAGDSGVYAACADGVWVRGDAAWEPLETPGGRIESLLSDATGVLAGTASGLWRLAPDAPPALLHAPGPVDSLARAPDGSVYAGTSGGVIRIVGGEATPLGWPEGDVAVALSVAADGRVAAGTYRGAYVSEDAGVSWFLATDWDRYDDDDTAFVYVSGAWTPEAAGNMKSGDQTTANAGAVLSWRVEAAQLSLIGAGEGTVDVSVDGGEPGRHAVPEGAATTFWSATLQPGIHEVLLTVVSGTLHFDGGERWRESTGNPPSRTPAPTPDPECGCVSDTNGFSNGILAMILTMCQVAARRIGGARRPT